jgi:hypothetical protein
LGLSEVESMQIPGVVATLIARSATQATD